MTAIEAKLEAMTVGKLLDPQGGYRYLIPRYQRNYAWGEGEISQLVLDVEDYRRRGVTSRETSPYYIGTLVVHQEPGSAKYETVDGQQRLTTLSILMAYLRREGVASARDFTKPVIEFQSRANSDRVLKELFNITDPTLLDSSSSLTAGFGLVGRALREAFPATRKPGDHREPADNREWKEWLESFTHYLCHQVVIFRVHVPADTDLNHYFEVMNSRGEQLEKHEVLKADLMAELEPGDRHAFAKIWEACANMEKYVQMSFSTTERTALFGDQWDDFRERGFHGIREVLEPKREPVDAAPRTKGGADDGPIDVGGMRLGAILDGELITAKSQAGQEGHPDQFHPVINFPNFLLHVLSVHAELSSISLDDKNLLDAFKDELLGGCDENGRAEAVRSFACSLLRARYLFDRFVMKRDLRGGSDEWSLLRLKQTSDRSSYGRSFPKIPAIDAGGLDNRRLLMLQAALHISNPSMSYKYWVLGALRYLMQQSDPGEVDAADYLRYLESIVRGFVFDAYLPDNAVSGLGEITSQGEPWQLKAKGLNRDTKYLRYGDIRNNLLFNFLDYLLWVGNRKRPFRERNFKVEAFKFTARSSVEHHWPQHPDDLKGEVHRFGNLYLISHSRNSKLSNFRADSKKREFLSSGTADSLKQQFMIDHQGDWDLNAIKKHEDEMLDVLSAALVQKLPFLAANLAVPS